MEKCHFIKIITTMVIRPLDDRTYCHIVLDLHSLIWGFGESCTRSLHHFAASQWVGPKM